MTLTVHEIRALLGCYTAQNYGFAPTFRDNLSFSYSRVKPSSRGLLGPLR